MNDSAPQQPDPPPEPDLEQIIEIMDPAVNVVKVMADIRATLAGHGPFTQPDVPAFDAIGGEAGSLSFYLRQADLEYDQTWVELNVIRPNLPLVGAPLLRAKTLLHELVVYYVNLHAAKQINVNAALLHALKVLAMRDEEIAVLRSELIRIKARLAELESRG